MPNNNICNTSAEQMTPEEIGEIAKMFYSLGVDKIRLTGGEPLARKDFKEIVNVLKDIPVTLALTTNALLLDKYMSELQKANFTKLNISLDSLKPDRFSSITGNNSYQKVYYNILKAINAGFDVKINAVVMKNFNEDEIVDFAKLTMNLPITMRFIEFMPFKDNNWSFGRIVKQKEIISKLQDKFDLTSLDSDYSSTAQNFKINNSIGKIGVISTVSHPFCDSCNRIRITSDGKLKSCLFGHNEYDLLTPLRRKEDVLDSIKETLHKKSLKHGGKKSFLEEPEDFQNNRNMHSIGG